MKIQCDACNREGASVFCYADEAALCESCDRGVHHANKLANKHHRFSLLNPSSKEAPRCDICQDRRAFLFCQEDRAILCRECDVPIHMVNDLTAKHNRFLLTGVKLSSNSTCFNHAEIAVVEEKQAKKSKEKNLTNSLCLNPAFLLPEIENTSSSNSANQVFRTSSISDYLIKMLPGWHVEDFFVDSMDFSSATDGFSKNDDLVKFLEPDLDSDLGFGYDDQVPQIFSHSQDMSLPGPVCKLGIGMKPIMDLKDTNHLKVHQRGWSDHGFTVPQLSSPLKRSRHHYGQI